MAARPAFGPLTLPAYDLVPSRGRLLVRMAWRGGRGGIAWTLRVVVPERGGRRVTVVRGEGPAGERVVRRSAGIPARWRGRAARIRLEVTDGLRTIRRERLVRLR